MTDEYRVPEVLRQVREARLLPLKERGEKYAPSALYAMCEASTDGRTTTSLLYQHAMVEVGFVGPPGQGDRDATTFETYKVCPVCGFVLESD